MVRREARESGGDHTMVGLKCSDKELNVFPKPQSQPGPALLFLSFFLLEMSVLTVYT